MMDHRWRPLLGVMLLIVLVLGGRWLLVPADFGAHERGYMYGWHRKGNEAEWKGVTVKYRGREYCRPCHRKNYDSILPSPHGGIGCENCHGPALDHPRDPRTMRIDRSRALCIRCHSRLPYGSGGRGAIRGIDPVTHNPEEECTLCHYPHDPRKGGER